MNQMHRTQTQTDSTHGHQSPPLDNHNDNDNDNETIAHETMMSRRIERKRWEALRNVSRAVAKLKKSASEGKTSRSKVGRWNETCAEHLAPVNHMELSTAKTNASKDRARRRNERMAQNINAKLDNCFKEQDL